MNDRQVLIILIASLGMLVALFLDQAYLYAISFPFVMFAWMYAGAERRQGIGQGYKYSLLAVLLIWLGGFLLMNFLDPTQAPDSYPGGFPPATFIMVYIVWGLPFFVGTYTFGHFFESDCISPKQLQELEQGLAEESKQKRTEVR